MPDHHLGWKIRLLVGLGNKRIEISCPFQLKRLLVPAKSGCWNHLRPGIRASC
ncbi:MAG: hypothetical protein R2806_23670 [Saprospiraceae bacterium]